MAARKQEVIRPAGAARSLTVRWRPAWRKLGDFIGRHRYALVVAVAVALVAGGQLVEDLADSPAGRMFSPELATRRWTVIALVLYVLVIAGLVSRTLQAAFLQLRPVLRIDQPAYERYQLQLKRPDWRLDAVLLMVSSVVVILLFVVLSQELPISNDLGDDGGRYLPAAPAAALMVVAAYSVVGWAGLRLVIGAIRLGRVLGRLSREPFNINVFDTTPLVPFGTIALTIALAPAGIIAILLLGLGPPSTFLGWTVLLLASLGSLLALLLPLRGIHRQMSEAKDAALADLNGRIALLYDEISALPDMPATEVARYRDTANSLIPLRKTVEEMTTWPFRDTVAFGRAVLIASAPLIYTTLSELIKVFVIGPLSR